MKKKYIRPSLYVVHIEPETIIASSREPGFDDNLSDRPQLARPKNFEENVEYWD